MLLLFLIVIDVTSQETTWYDAEWNETTESNAAYYRPKPAKIKKGYWVIDYYKNGSVKREGYTKKPKKKHEGFEGLVIEYHPNGKAALKLNYKRGVLHGLHREYFTTGELKKQTRYRNGNRDGVWKEYYKSGKIKTKGKYRNGEKVGVWKTYYKNEYNSILDY